MSLTNFFRINLPYGMRKNDHGEWGCFNREYIPLGFNDTYGQFREISWKKNNNYPISTKYKSLTDNFLRKLIKKYDLYSTEKDGSINGVWFYSDGTNPSSEKQGKYWDKYFSILKDLSKLKPSWDDPNDYR